MIEVKILYSPIDEDLLNSLIADGWVVYNRDNKSIWLKRPKP